MFRFPWGDMHSLNLGWFLQKFNELREDWATAKAGIDGALDAEIQRAEDALSDVFDARDAAAASATAATGSASSAGTSATAAQNSATAAASSATLANQKATAAGISEAAAAQSAAAASNSATAAAGSATTASTAATNAAGSATAAGNSATAANTSKGAAEAAAAGVVNENLISEGFAVGEQNGEAVPSTSPYYQNNAKYYAEQAASAVSGAGIGQVVFFDPDKLTDGTKEFWPRNVTKLKNIIYVEPTRLGSGSWAVIPLFGGFFTTAYDSIAAANDANEVSSDNTVPIAGDFDIFFVPIKGLVGSYVADYGIFTIDENNVVTSAVIRNPTGNGIMRISEKLPAAITNKNIGIYITIHGGGTSALYPEKAWVINMLPLASDRQVLSIEPIERTDEERTDESTENQTEERTDNQV